ncbi:hypothetical protein AgCh_011205 [Apium graveolens]
MTNVIEVELEKEFLTAEWTAGMISDSADDNLGEDHELIAQRLGGLGEYKIRISNIDYTFTSIITSIIRPPRISPHPPPKLNPPTYPILSDKITRMPRIVGRPNGPPPPAPYTAHPHHQANADQRWTSIFGTRGTTLGPSHFSQQVPKDNEIIERPSLPSPPPPLPAPPHIQRYLVSAILK